LRRHIPILCRTRRVLVEISGAIWMQVVVSIVGILMMTALAYYRSWSKNADKAPKIKPIVAAAG
jgi:OpgC protein